MEREEFDLIAVGRALLNDAGWATKVRAGEAHALRGFYARRAGAAGLKAAARRARKVDPLRRLCLGRRNRGDPRDGFDLDECVWRGQRCDADSGECGARGAEG